MMKGLALPASLSCLTPGPERTSGQAVQLALDAGQGRKAARFGYCPRLEAVVRPMYELA